MTYSVYLIEYISWTTEYSSLALDSTLYFFWEGWIIVELHWIQREHWSLSSCNLIKASIEWSREYNLIKTNAYDVLVSETSYIVLARTLNSWYKVFSWYIL